MCLAYFYYLRSKEAVYEVTSSSTDAEHFWIFEAAKRWFRIKWNDDTTDLKSTLKREKEGTVSRHPSKSESTLYKNFWKVEARLNSEFATLGRVGPDGSHIVAKIIKNVDPLLQKHWDEIQADEEQEAQRDAAQILAELREEDEDDAFEQPVLEHGGNFA